MPPPPIPVPDVRGKDLKWPLPKLLIKINDLSHDGAAVFCEAINPQEMLTNAVVSVFEWLYTPQDVPIHVRSVTLVVRDMEGVAYTTGSELDNDHKEIHLSLQHIHNIADRARHEITGVVTHEMVHCFQYNARGTCPGGVIEGIADWVRLNCRLAPPHWTQGGKRWDEGYQTTAYFFDWIEKTYGQGSIPQLNQALRDREYSEDIFVDITGEKVSVLWKKYSDSLQNSVA